MGHHLVGGRSWQRVGKIRRKADLRDRAESEAAAPNVQYGSTFALPGDIGYGDALRAQATGDTNGPTAAHLRPGRGHLGDDFSFRNISAVEFALDHQLQSGSGAGVLGFGRSHADDLRNSDFAAVDGEAHGRERRDEGDGHENQRQQYDSKEAAH